MIHYHGTPITPRAKLLELAGRHFCVSYARPDDVKICYRIGQSVMLDNGAFSAWRSGYEPDWLGWAEWAGEWLAHPTSWAVLPDTIDGGTEENDELLDQWGDVFGPQGAPVWHLDEPIARLRRLVSSDRYSRICFGSAGRYAILGTDEWHRRVAEAFDSIADPLGRVPWIHMLRGLAFSSGPYPFASADSTDLARNHNRGRPIREMADRWDSMQPPARWDSRGAQLNLMESV